MIDHNASTISSDIKTPAKIITPHLCRNTPRVNMSLKINLLLIYISLFHDSIGDVTNPLECLCTPWRGILSCCGINVTTFPLFNQSYRQTVTHIEIVNTSLSHLPNITHSGWPNLISFDFRGNNQLSCNETLILTQMSPDLNISTDCFTGIVKDSLCRFGKEGKRVRRYFISLLIFPIASIPLSIYLKLRNQTNDTDWIYKSTERCLSSTSSRVVHV